MDLRHLLVEAGQELPVFLKELIGDDGEIDANQAGGEDGCAYCSGLGHRITNCPKLEGLKSKTANNLLRPDFSGQEGL